MGRLAVDAIARAGFANVKFRRREQDWVDSADARFLPAHPPANEGPAVSVTNSVSLVKVS